MLHPFTEFDDPFTIMGELRRRMDRLWDEAAVGEQPQGFDTGLYTTTAWPKVDVRDAGQNLVLRADLPGLAEKDIALTLTPDGLTLSGERKTTTPEGYSAQRQERPSAKFSRSWTLPYKVDADKTTATLKDGVLTVTLTKAPDAQPRQITVRAQA